MSDRDKEVDQNNYILHTWRINCRFAVSLEYQRSFMQEGVRSAISLWLVLLCFSCLNGQSSLYNNIIDLRSDVKVLWQKSNSDIPSNFVALPILTSTRKKNIVLPFVSTQAGQYEAEILLGDGAEVYLVLSDLELKDGESLKVYSSENLWSPEIYTSSDNKESRQMMMGPYIGDVSLSILAAEKPKVTLNQVYANPINVGHMSLGFDASFDCHLNINCEEGAGLSDVKRSVMRIRMVAEEGVALCTGTLMNNTSGDRTPYVLTAFHCLVPPDATITPLFDLFWFDFNYESFSCANPEEEPFPFQIQGAELLAEWEDTDMMLLRITDDIPLEANVFYAGWDRRLDYEPDTTYLIHHPVGDIKKVTIDVDTALIHDRRIGWNNGSNSPEFSHYINDFDDTTYEPGSSGAPIFDDNGSVLGQLHGGPLSDEFCSIGIGYSGRLSVSWDTGNSQEDRLRDWLDPINEGVMSMGGLDQIQIDVVSFTGSVLTADGLSIPDVRVSLTGDMIASFLTGSDGRFVFENLDPNGTYSIELDKNTIPSNGLSATDLVILRNHIVGRQELTNEFALLSGDVNGDGRISSVDLVQIRNQIIGRQERFPNRPSWDFEPSNFQVDMNSALSGEIKLDIIGYKIGDVNYSANPKR